MQPFSEVPIKPDVSGTVEMPETNVDRHDETEGWKNSIELPDDTGEWVDSIELPDDSDGWQDSINVDSVDDVHRNGDGVEEQPISDHSADNPFEVQTDSHFKDAPHPQIPDKDWPAINRAVSGKSIDEPTLDGNTTIDERAKSEANEGDYPSTYKERMDQTPRDDGERGEWQGERGESVFIPNDSEIKEILEEYEIEGIAYEDAIPDFSPCSESTVVIDNMTDNRNGPPVEGSNFQQCDQKCAEQWNEQCREGKSDWSARDVANWRREHGYSWHERNDMKTCDLIPTKINAYFGHLGGVGEYIRLPNSNLTEDVFDE